MKRRKRKNHCGRSHRKYVKRKNCGRKFRNPKLRPFAGAKGRIQYPRFDVLGRVFDDLETAKEFARIKAEESNRPVDVMSKPDSWTMYYEAYVAYPSSMSKAEREEFHNERHHPRARNPKSCPVCRMRDAWKKRSPANKSSVPACPKCGRKANPFSTPDVLIARWQTKGKDWVELWKYTDYTPREGQGYDGVYYYKGKGMGGGLPNTVRTDAEAVAYMERPWGRGGAGQAFILKLDRPSLKRVKNPGKRGGRGREIHSLARPGTPAGEIRFIHKDGKEHVFYSVVNDLSGSRLSAFDNDAPSVDDSIAWVKSVFRDIRKKAKVVKVIGDF